jgi:hypothetical protein
MLHSVVAIPEYTQANPVSDQPNKPSKSAKEARAERLAAELRENLKKRKAQARARKTTAPELKPKQS